LPPTWLKAIAALARPACIGSGSQPVAPSAHLRVAQAWGYVEPWQVAQAMKLADRELRLLSGLTR
jgi:hypothetical protein